jgi:protein TonB
VTALTRYAIAIVAASGIALSLFYLMQFLISTELGWTEAERGPLIEFVRLLKDSDLEQKKRLRPDRVQPVERPPPPPIDFSKAARPDQDLGDSLPVFDRDVDLAGGLALGTPPSDSDIIPLVRVVPQYPATAQSRGIEGWVQVEFTITAAGTVRDPVVIAAEPPRIFNRAALRAIGKWKYNPKIDDGKAVERPGVRVRLDFRIDE